MAFFARWLRFFAFYFDFFTFRFPLFAFFCTFAPDFAKPLSEQVVRECFVITYINIYYIYGYRLN